MPLAQRLVHVVGGDAAGNGLRLDADVGRPVTVPLPELNVQPDVIGPDGEQVRSRIDAARLVFTPAEPGAYAVVVDGAPPLAWVAANPLPEESDVRRSGDLLAVQRELDPERMLRHVDLSRWAWIAALVAMCVSAIGAMRGTSA